MPWTVKSFQLIETDPEDRTVFDSQAEAEQEADNIMFAQPGEIFALAVECDEDGEEVY
jgi:hypothetical protein